MSEGFEGELSEGKERTQHAFGIKHFSQRVWDKSTVRRGGEVWLGLSGRSMLQVGWLGCGGRGK